MYHVVTSRHGFAGAFTDENALKVNVTDKYPHVDIVVDTYKKTKDDVEEVWVLLRKSDGTPAYVSDNRDDAKATYDKLRKVDIVWESEQDEEWDEYVRFPVNVIPKFIEQQFKIDNDILSGTKTDYMGAEDEKKAEEAFNAIFGEEIKQNEVEKICEKIDGQSEENIDEIIVEQ